MTLNRRKLLQVIGASAALASTRFALASANIVRLGAQTNAWPIDAADLGSLRSVLRQIKSTGYDGFETGYFNLTQHLTDISSTRKQLEASGLIFFGLHVAVGADKCDPETLLPLPCIYEPMAKAARDLGAKHWIVSSIPNKSPEAAQKKIAGLRNASQYAATIGLPLLYHNHDWEFSNGGTEMDALFSGTADLSLRFLLDAGHAFHAGADVPSLLQTRLGRIAAFHLRDYRDGKQVPLGSGDFPLTKFANILKQRAWSGWVLNEEDSDGKQKLGSDVIDPAFRALRKEFRA